MKNVLDKLIEKIPSSIDSKDIYLGKSIYKEIEHLIDDGVYRGYNIIKCFKAPKMNAWVSNNSYHK